MTTPLFQPSLGRFGAALCTRGKNLSLFDDGSSTVAYMVQGLDMVVLSAGGDLLNGIDLDNAYRLSLLNKDAFETSGTPHKTHN